MHLMILGAGFSGKAIAQAAGAHFARISGTTRSAAKADRLATMGIEPLVFDGEAITPELAAAFATVTHLVQSIAPGSSGDPILRLLGNNIKSVMPQLQWIGYLSTVGVYGDHNGAWVDEDTLCKPVSVRSVERVDAENGWLQLAQATGLSVAILRLSGIYGPGRNTFCNLADGTARRLVKKDQVFNRIRVEDIGGATLLLMRSNTAGIFNITDQEPAPPQDVVEEAAQLMGVPVPPEMDFETAELSPMARSFYGENKRVSNRKIRDLGYEFLYPDYRMSLQNLWSSGTWR